MYDLYFQHDIHFLHPQTGNEAFSGITRSYESLRNFPITIFELIESKSLPSWYGMLASAIHNISIVEDSVPPALFLPSSSSSSSSVSTNDQDIERSLGSSHLSITLPCKMFRDSSSRYNITVSYSFNGCGVNHVH